MDRLEIDVAFLALGVRRALLDSASLYLLSAWYCSALPPWCIFLQICLCPRRQWSCWHVELQYLVLHLTQRGASWASGAAQAAQFVRIKTTMIRRVR